MNTAKIITTWNCNLACPYCCNEIVEVRDSFKPITLNELSMTDYRDYEITGGEPLLDIDCLCRVLLSIPHGRNKYLYTNGTILPLVLDQAWNALKQFNGINIGYHDIQLNWPVILRVHDVVPVRLWVQDSDMTDEIRDLGLPLQIWTQGECFNVTTDRYYVEWK